MKLTARSEYALLALIHLARCDSSDYITVDAIATAQAIPPKFLEQIMLTLKRARFVTSSKGQHGGYKLVPRPTEISLASVVRLFEGALAPTESVSEYYYESTPIEREGRLKDLFREIRDWVAHKLENTSLQDVL